MPSSKAEPIKLWLAKVGYERMQEMADPALSLNRARQTWQQHGRSDKWIQQRMTGQETRKGTNHYRYYMPSADKKFGSRTNPVGAIPAEAIESLVVEQVLAALQSPQTVQSVWDEVRCRDPSIEEPVVVVAMRNLAVVWKELFPAEQTRLIQLLVERVQIRDDGLNIEWHAIGWSELASELAPNTIGAELREREAETV